MVNVIPTVIEGRSLRLRLRLQPTTGVRKGLTFTKHTSHGTNYITTVKDVIQTGVYVM